jgi:hypothetical protein
MEYPDREIAEMISASIQTKNMKIGKLSSFKIIERDSVCFSDK